MAKLQFNNSINKELSIVHGILKRTGTDTTSYPLVDITRAVNKWNSKVWGWIQEAYSGWMHDDLNRIDLPQSVRNLSKGVSTYVIDTEGLIVVAVDVKDSSGNWRVLKPITIEKIRQSGYAVEDFYKSDGVPRFYRLVGNTIELFPAPNYDSIGGLKMFFMRGSVKFSPSDTTMSPGFDEEFHEVLIEGGAYEWFKDNGPESDARNALSELADYEIRIKNHYSTRFMDREPARISPRYHNPE